MEVGNESAGWLSAATVGIVAAWNFFFKGRKDLREDASEKQQRDGWQEQQTAYKALIAEQVKAMDSLRSLLEQESTRRHAAETRIAILEAQVIRLGGTI
jgi:hypothetical protein